MYTSPKQCAPKRSAFFRIFRYAVPHNNRFTHFFDTISHYSILQQMLFLLSLPHLIPQLRFWTWLYTARFQVLSGEYEDELSKLPDYTVQHPRRKSSVCLYPLHCFYKGCIACTAVVIYFHTKRLKQEQHKKLVGCAELHKINISKIQNINFLWSFGMLLSTPVRLQVIFTIIMSDLLFFISVLAATIGIEPRIF
jgi:hypothetical protein